MKDAGTLNWITPNTGGNNESGFAGLPGGYRTYGGALFTTVGAFGFWWSASEFNTTDAWCRNLYYNNSNLTSTDYRKSGGFSVRCRRD